MAWASLVRFLPVLGIPRSFLAHRASTSEGRQIEGDDVLHVQGEEPGAHTARTPGWVVREVKRALVPPPGSASHTTAAGVDSDKHLLFGKPIPTGSSSRTV